MSKRTIIPYLHLYLGCEVEFLDKDNEINRGILSFVGLNHSYILRSSGIHLQSEKVKNGKIKPILHPFGSMTEEERKAVYGNFGQLGLHEKPSNIDYFKPEGLRYMLGKNIDLFNLIDEGLAIDATTINNQTINQ